MCAVYDVVHVYITYFNGVHDGFQEYARDRGNLESARWGD